MSADFHAQLEVLRPYLLRYAAVELRNREVAEDCVQEALVAALAAPASFEGRSNLRTWLTGILKHKIVDAIRRQSRERPVEGLEEDMGDLDALFDDTGHWADRPQPWDDPDAALHQKQFLAALEACLGGLPPRTAQVFMLREHLGLETAEICKELGLTSTNCWVLLYRARMLLRKCLEKNWFRR
ncbi:MAG TPA: sigma-70 family RNA polymerase sigma factor [Burkholderiales bacterium]|nr:sigma-70 family RNA polymerase sigma factor [Burkholderiales bacterium]